MFGHLEKSWKSNIFYKKMRAKNLVIFFNISIPESEVPNFVAHSVCITSSKVGKYHHSVNNFLKSNVDILLDRNVKKKR